MRRGGEGNRRRGPPSYPMQCLGGTPHVSPSGYDWRDGVRPRSYRGLALASLLAVLGRAGAPSESDIRVPSRVLSAAKQGEAEHPRGWVPLQERRKVRTDRFPRPGRNEDEYRFPRATAHLVQNKRGAASHTGDSASFVRAESAEKLSLPRRTQPESAHARERRQPDRGWPS